MESLLLQCGFSPIEIRTIYRLAKKQDLSVKQVIKQAMREYQLTIEPVHFNQPKCCEEIDMNVSTKTSFDDIEFSIEETPEGLPEGFEEALNKNGFNYGSTVRGIMLTMYKAGLAQSDKELFVIVKEEAVHGVSGSAMPLLGYCILPTEQTRSMIAAEFRMLEQARQGYQDRIAALEKEVTSVKSDLHEMDKENDRLLNEHDEIKKSWKDCVLENIAHEESLVVTIVMYEDAKDELAACHKQCIANGNEVLTLTDQLEASQERVRELSEWKGQAICRHVNLVYLAEELSKPDSSKEE